MPTIATSQSATVNIASPNGYITVTCVTGDVMQVDWTSPGSISGSRTVRQTTEDVGPFADGTVVTLRAISGSPQYTDAQTTAAQTAAIQALVSGAGIPSDTLVAPLQRVTITGALSATAALAAAATGTYYKARVGWNNNGASAAAKLRIAVNADNDVHGLSIGQSAKRRDYEMTMGDGVLLVCGVPITRLTFSADSAIVSATHSLHVTFGN